MKNHYYCTATDTRYNITMTYNVSYMFKTFSPTECTQFLIKEGAKLLQEKLEKQFNDCEEYVERKTRFTFSLLHSETTSEPIESQGWKCEGNSPTGYCDYQQEDGSIDEDSCRYCGQPDERK